MNKFVSERAFFGMDSSFVRTGFMGFRSQYFIQIELLLVMVNDWKKSSNTRQAVDYYYDKKLVKSFHFRNQGNLSIPHIERFIKKLIFKHFQRDVRMYSNLISEKNIFFIFVLIFSVYFDEIKIEHMIWHEKV